MPRETMTSRERVLKALSHQEPDRVPIDLGGNQTGIHKFAYQALLQHLGIADELVIMDAVQQLARPCEALLQRFHVDTRYIGAGAGGRLERGHREKSPRRAAVARSDRRVRRHLVDARRPALLHGHFPSSLGRGHDRRYAPSTHFPRGTIRAASPACANGRCRSAKETPYAVVGGIAGVVYEICWYMRGLEQWFTDMLTQPEFCGPCWTRRSKFWLDWCRLFLDEVGDLVDVIMIGDDLAGQKGPLFRPAFIAQIVKPRQKALVQYIRSRTKAKIWYHTCGACMRVHSRPAGQRHRHSQSGADQRQGNGPGRC